MFVAASFRRSCAGHGVDVKLMVMILMDGVAAPRREPQNPLGLCGNP